jgi:hypothetical protein
VLEPAADPEPEPLGDCDPLELEPDLDFLPVLPVVPVVPDCEELPGWLLAPLPDGEELPD